MKRLLCLLILLPMVVTAAGAQGFDDIAEGFVPALARLAGPAGTPPRLAVWSGPEKRLPVAPSVVQRLETGLQASLLGLKAPPEIMIRSELTVLIDDLAATGALDSPLGDPIGDLLSNARSIDALIIGTYRLDDRMLIAHYRLVSLSGQVLAVSGELRHVLSPADLQAEPGAVNLNVALDELAASITDVLADGRRLRMGTVRQAGSGGMSRFGDYVRKALTSRLLAGNNDLIGAAPLKVISQPGAGVVADIPVVSGEYWVRGTAVSLAMTVAAGEAITGTFLRHIRTDSLGGLRLSPDPGFDRLTVTDDLGPPTISISLPDEMPVLQVGEPLAFDVRLRRAGYLWCFYVQADGVVRQIIPNPGLLDRRGDSWIEDGAARRLPVPQRDGFRLVASPPGGPELLKCLVTDRDVRRELPQEMQGLTLDPLPQGLSSRIVEIFRSLPNLRIAEDSLFVTVVDPSGEGATSGR